MEIISKYFTDLSEHQTKQFSSLFTLYKEWNDKINVISRKDFDFFYEKHVLHSLALAKILSPKSGTSFLDIGTGGGLPTIPLAIMFPECEFYSIDKIGKKILVVNEISKSLGLTNLKAEKARAQDISSQYDFILARAVTKTKSILDWTKNLLTKNDQNIIKNSWILWKGGDLEAELESIPHNVFKLSDYFDEDFYQTKKIIVINKVHT